MSAATGIRHKVRAAKYSFIAILIGAGMVSILAGGWWTWALGIYGFVIVPFFELFIRPDAHNMSEAEEAVAKKEPFYDLLLYLMVPVQYALLVLYLTQVGKPGLEWYEYVGMTFSMGVACGVIGINVAHELGHRKTWYEKLMAKSLLLTSMYMHFFIEHNRGHHHHVSTPNDPASARYGEPLYAFWIRSVRLSWLSAWKLEQKRLKKKELPFFSLHNEMLVFQLIQLAFLAVIGLAFSWQAMLCFLGAATVGFLLLETVNYIEHYGLRRKEIRPGIYESVKPYHSWNSDHILGRMILFELSRHSDHHYRASRKYQVLRHFDDTPQMPTGYPGMILLSLVPPLWFRVMHKRIREFSPAS